MGMKHGNQARCQTEAHHMGEPIYCCVYYSVPLHYNIPRRVEDLQHVMISTLLLLQ